MQATARAGDSAASARRFSPRRRLMAVLLAAEISGATAHAIVLAVGGIVAADITGTNTWSGLPVAVGALGAALASLPLSHLMGRFGRRPGLALGYALAVLGSGLSMVGVVARSFPIFLIGMTLFGIGNTSNLLARYAAADVSPLAQRGRAIGLVIGGATIGSVVGPNLLGPATTAGDLLGLPFAASSFLIGLGGFGLAGLLIGVFLRPDPLAVARRLEAPAAGVPVAPTGSVRQVLRRPRVRIALGALMVGQLVMIGTTATAPLYLHDHGHHVGAVGLAASLHLAGMYAAAPLSGWLCDRVGRPAVVLAGGLLLIGAVVFAGLAPAADSLLVSLALFLNGVGWNFGFVAASALLTDALAPAERPSMQGLADLLMGLMGALGSAAGGIILQAWGFAALNAIGAALVVGPLAAVWLWREQLAAGLAESATPHRATA